MEGKLGKFVKDAEFLLREFDNAEDLLQENALFSKIFMELCQGMSPYKAIEHLIVITDKYQKQLEQIVEKRIPTITVELNENNLDLLYKEAFLSELNYPDW